MMDFFYNWITPIAITIILFFVIIILIGILIQVIRQLKD